LILREMLRCEDRYVCFTYCWVMVDAPCRAPEPRTSEMKARTMLTGLRAPSLKKCRSSVDTTALITTWGTSESGTSTRFCSEKVASTCCPLESYTNVVCLSGVGLGSGIRDK
jgi:hypothetical protein